MKRHSLTDRLNARTELSPKLGYLLLLLALPASSLASVIYTDATFPTASYPVLFSFNLNDTTAGQMGTVSDGAGPAQCASCGNPGQALQTIFTTTASNIVTTAIMDVGVINSAFSYDPSVMGPLMFVSGSMDASDSNSNIGYPSEGSFNILIEQGGNFYFSELFVNGTGFNTLSQTNLTAASFRQIMSNGFQNPSSHPNFNSGVMDFGLYMTSGALNSPSNTETITYDNLNLTLTSAPEPGSLCPAGVALAGLALLRRFKLSN
jgi:hypothetical protein